MEKTLRVLGNEDSSSTHPHSHSHSQVEAVASRATGVSPSISHNGVRERNPEKVDADASVAPTNTNDGPSKLSAYLNLFGDFVHNM